jgi:hypothetical protein
MYTGEAPLVGLSAAQSAAVEAACAAAPNPSWRDGLRRAVALNLVDLPVSDVILQAALDSALLDSGVPLGHLPPYTRAATGGFGGNGKLGSSLGMVDVSPAAGLGSNNTIIAAVLAALQLLKGAIGGAASIGCDIQSHTA